MEYSSEYDSNTSNKVYKNALFVVILLPSNNLIYPVCLLPSDDLNIYDIYDIMHVENNDACMYDTSVSAR